VTVVLIALTAFVIFAIAAVAIGRATFSAATTARQSVFDLDEAVDFVADRLPYELQARLSHDDVRAVLGWMLDELERVDVAFERDELRDDHEDAEVVVDDHDMAARVIGRAEKSALELSDVDVLLILDEGEAYLRAIGAVGAEAGVGEQVAPRPADGGPERSGDEGDAPDAPTAGGHPG
jgi:hypothetical protein